MVDAIRIHVPELEVRFVDSPIMNQLSYEVLNARFAKAGFQVCGSMANGIADTIGLIKKADSM